MNSAVDIDLLGFVLEKMLSDSSFALPQARVAGHFFILYVTLLSASSRQTALAASYFLLFRTNMQYGSV